MHGLAAAGSGLHLVIGFVAVILDTGFIGVYAFCGDVAEVPIRQASGPPTVLDLERTQGCKGVEDTYAETLVGQ